VTAARTVVDHFADGPVVTGPLEPDLAGAHRSARAAQAAIRAASGWPDCPRPVESDDLLPERALSGDGHARRQLVEEVYVVLADSPPLLETVSTYLGLGASIEATGRALFVHPNTVRYRLRTASERTGLALTEPRGAFTAHIALVLGRLREL
jgi:DNA-binding PucR family transcriptional regulator